MSPRAANHLLAIAAATAAMVPAVAQGGIQVIAATGQGAPGVPGAQFGGASTFDAVVIDANGYVLFRGRLTGGGVTSLDERALFHGSSAGDLQLVIRGADPAPGIAGATLNTATSPGLGGNVRLSENGSRFFGSALAGSGVTSANDSALFGGAAAGGLTLLVREGDPAPGTAGASLGSHLADLPHQASAIDDAGRLLFQSATVGGDTVPGNNAAWFTGLPGALAMVQRKGDVVLGGAVVAALGSTAQMNVHGMVLHETTLSTTSGSAPATAANDRALWVYTPGLGNSLLVREGDAALGTAGATFNNPTNTWSPSVGATAFNIFGQTLLVAPLMNGDVVPGVNDIGLFTGDVGMLRLTLRRGDSAPGTMSTFSNFVAGSAVMGDKRRCTRRGYGGGGSCPELAIAASVAGGGATASSDTGIWFGSLAGVTMIAREGNPAPGTAGAAFGDFAATKICHNDRGQILFFATLVGGDVGTNPGDHIALYAHDPYVGLHLVQRGGSSIDVGGGVVKQVASFAAVAANNSGGRSLAFNQLGDFAVVLTMTDGTAAVAKGHVGSAEVSAYGLGCAGAGGTAPTLSGVGLPILGSASFGFRIQNGVPASLALVAAGFAPTSLPVGGCTLLVAPPIVILPTILLDGVGSGSVSLGIPSDPSIMGAIVYAQGLALDPIGPFLGLGSLSNGLAAEVGN